MVKPSAFVLFPAVFIKARVTSVEVFAVQAVGCEAQPFAEALIVHDLALT